MSVSTTNKSFLDLRDLFEKKEISVREAITSYLEQIEKGKYLNSYINVLSESALSKADESDKRYKDGANRPLEGLPLGVKDIFCTKDIETTASSNALKGFTPGYTATVIKNLEDQGAIILGKQNLDEFAMGVSNENSSYGPVHNPWKKGHSPGGSSGGSACSVASGLACVAIGSDSGGSVRQPASLNGIVGMKPTYGSCSRWGIIAFASSLDQAGVLSKTVKDNALALNYMVGRDENDFTTSYHKFPNLVPQKPKIKGLKIGIPKEYKMDNVSDEIIKMWEHVSKIADQEGAEIIEISLAHADYALPVYHVIAPSEASSNLSRYDGIRYGDRVDFSGSIEEDYKNNRSSLLGEEVRRRILVGTYALSSHHHSDCFENAQKVRSLIAQDFEKAFSEIDFILCPSSPTTAFPFSSQTVLEGYANDILTTQASLVGLPSISIPVGFDSKKLPIGMQLIGKKFSEPDLFKFALGMEEAINFDPEIKDRWWEDTK